MNLSRKTRFGRSRGHFCFAERQHKKDWLKNRDGYELAIHALELLRDMAFDGVHINWVMHSNNADDFDYLVRNI